MHYLTVVRCHCFDQGWVLKKSIYVLPLILYSIYISDFLSFSQRATGNQVGYKQLTWQHLSPIYQCNLKADFE